MLRAVLLHVVEPAAHVEFHTHSLPHFQWLLQDVVDETVAAPEHVHGLCAANRTLQQQFVGEWNAKASRG